MSRKKLKDKGRKNPCLLYGTSECIEPKKCRKGRGVITRRDSTGSGRISCSNYVGPTEVLPYSIGQVESQGLEREAFA